MSDGYGKLRWGRLLGEANGGDQPGLWRGSFFERAVIPAGGGGGGHRADLSHVPEQKALCFKGKQCSQRTEIQTYVNILKTPA